jgi:hypothetical protein
MKRSLKDILIGLTVFGILAVVVIWLAYIELIIPPQIIAWLQTSPNPQQAVIAMGTLTSAVILILLRAGVAIPFLQKYIPDTEQSRRYIAGLPLWVMGVLIAASLVGLLAVFPACQPPSSVIFDTAKGSLHSNETLTVKIGEKVNITAKSIEEGVRLHCQWQYAGNAFQSLGTRKGCDITVEFSPKPGEGFLTLLASNNFCTQSTVFSLPVKVEQP